MVLDLPETDPFIAPICCDLGLADLLGEGPEHIAACLKRSRIAVIGLLSGDHLHEFRGDIDVGILQAALGEGSKAIASAAALLRHA